MHNDRIQNLITYQRLQSAQRFPHKIAFDVQANGDNDQKENRSQ